jgi:prephenate dehydratase
MPARYSYLGPEGTFTEEALRTLPSAAGADLMPARSVPEALDAVRSGTADAALVPLENSVGGGVPDTLDELGGGVPLHITAEVLLPVQFTFVTRPDTEVADVRSVAAHPQAAVQCRDWLRTTVPSATVVDSLSNATAAVQVARGEYDAALTTALAAGSAGLAVRAGHVADHPDAVTRFVLVTRPAPPAPPTGNDVTTIGVFIVHERVGALLSVLTELSVRGVNLTRIESRPTGERLGRYGFFLDCTGHVAEARMGEALAGLHRVCADVRFLGSYPRAGVNGHTEPPVPPPAGSSDAEFAAATEWLTRVRAGDPV